MNRLLYVITLNHRETFNVTHKHNDWQTTRIGEKSGIWRIIIIL